MIHVLPYMYNYKFGLNYSYKWFHRRWKCIKIILVGSWQTINIFQSTQSLLDPFAQVKLKSLLQISLAASSVRCLVKTILTTKESQLKQMKNHKQWEERIQMNIKRVAPFYVLAPGWSLYHVLIGEKPRETNNISIRCYTNQPGQFQRWMQFTGMGVLWQ